MSFVWVRNAEKLSMHTEKPPSRPKPPEIRTIAESAPWVLLAKAANDSGVTERLIRQARLHLRRFGNADYIAPACLNSRILTGKEHE